MSRITVENTYAEAASLDPLKLDEAMACLPELNGRRRVDALSSAYSTGLQRSETLVEAGCSREQAVAALRDMDFLAASLVRHGVREVAEQTRAQTVLRALGEAALTVPRGTVFTYAASNPLGRRERTFTGTEGERLFIDAVRQGIYSLDLCIEALASVAQGEVEGLAQASGHMQQMVKSIVNVKRNITPEFFTFEMRPYFDELNIGGTAYAGAGGAQMQVVAVDRMLWGADCSDSAYASYYEDNVRYLTPSQRELISNFEASTGGKSIVTLIESGELPTESIASAYELLLTLRKFRYPHRRVANDNFALRSEGAVGSGTYTPTILDHLIELTESAMKRLEAINE